MSNLGNNNRLLRTVEVFREVGSDFAVPEDRARNVAKAAFAALGFALGGVVEPVGFKGLAIPSAEKVLDASRLRIPTAAPHTLVLTGRHLTRNGGLTVGFCRTVKDGPVTVSSSLTATVEDARADPYGLRTTETVIHEGAHSFGLEHCMDGSCVMHERDVRPPDDVGTDRIREPFCGNCIGDAELAGYAALAHAL